MEAEVEEEEEKGRMRKAELKVEKFTSRDRHVFWRAIGGWPIGGSELP